MLANRDADPLPAAVQRNIGDKLYEKRKSAALEVEQLVKALAVGNQTARINAIIDRLVNDYASSPQANCRKGGLLCLAAAAVGLANHHPVCVYKGCCLSVQRVLYVWLHMQLY